MNELELEQAILDYITTLYSACYIGFLQVRKLNPGYELSIGIPSYMFPTVISGDFTHDEDFLNYIFEELRVRNYMRTYFYKVNRSPNSSEDGASGNEVGQDRPTCEPRRINGPLYMSAGFTFNFPIILE